MSPMSLLNLSSEDLQAAHAREHQTQRAKSLSPHGERAERNVAQLMGLALLAIPLAMLLMPKL